MASGAPKAPQFPSTLTLLRLMTMAETMNRYNKGEIMTNRIACPRVLDQDGVDDTDWDDYTVDEIVHLIECNCIEESDIARYYNNLQWRDRV